MVAARIRRSPHLVAMPISNSKKMTWQAAKDEVEKGFSAVDAWPWAQRAVAVFRFFRNWQHGPGGDGLSSGSRNMRRFHATWIP